MTNQEKHQKIYELTGIEPKWWEDSDGLTPDEFVQKELVHTGWFINCASPHYPCEQLWEILESSLISTSSLLEVFNRALEKGDLHIALLDCVLWAIKENYICKKK